MINNSARIFQKIWLKNDEDLANYCIKLSSVSYVALDTEFIRAKEFYPKPGLLQLTSDGKQVVFIDPLCIKNWQPLAKILANRNITKVMHSAGEDLSLFSYLGIKIFENLFDTQIAEALMSKNHQISYNDLVKKYCNGATLGTAVTRSNWLKRPLDEAQLKYAADDVVYLYDIFKSIKVALIKLNRLEWHQEECATKLLRFSENESNFSDLWKKIHSVWKLSLLQKKVLQQLCVYREHKARYCNVLRSFILPSSLLYDLAKQIPKNSQQLIELGVDRSIVKYYGKEILEIISDSQKHTSLMDGKYYQLPTVIPKIYKPYFMLIRRHCNKLSKDHNFSVNILGVKAIATKCIRHYMKYGTFDMPKNITGWRKKLLTPTLITNLKDLEGSLKHIK